MEKMRIHELAKDLNTNSKRLMEKLEEINIHVKNHMSFLEEHELRALYEHIGIKSHENEKPATAEGEKKKIQTAGHTTGQTVGQTTGQIEGKNAAKISDDRMHRKDLKHTPLIVRKTEVNLDSREARHVGQSIQDLKKDDRFKDKRDSKYNRDNRDLSRRDNRKDDQRKNSVYDSLRKQEILKTSDSNTGLRAGYVHNTGIEQMKDIKNFNTPSREPLKKPEIKKHTEERNKAASTIMRDHAEVVKTEQIEKPAHRHKADFIKNGYNDQEIFTDNLPEDSDTIVSARQELTGVSTAAAKHMVNPETEKNKKDLKANIITTSKDKTKEAEKTLESHEAKFEGETELHIRDKMGAKHEDKLLEEKEPGIRIKDEAKTVESTALKPERTDAETEAREISIADGKKEANVAERVVLKSEEKAEPKTASISEEKAEAETKSKVASKPEAKRNGQTEPGTESKYEAKHDEKTGKVFKSELRTETMAAKTDAKVAKTEAKDEVKAEEVGTKAEEAEVKSEARTDTKSGLKPEAYAETKPEKIHDDKLLIKTEITDKKILPGTETGKDNIAGYKPKEISEQREEDREKLHERRTREETLADKRQHEAKKEIKTTQDGKSADGKSQENRIQDGRGHDRKTFDSGRAGRPNAQGIDEGKPFTRRPYDEKSTFQKTQDRRPSTQKTYEGKPFTPGLEVNRRPETRQADSARAYGRPETRQADSGRAYGRPETRQADSGRAYERPETRQADSGRAYGRPETRQADSGRAYERPETRQTDSGRAYGRPETRQADSGRAYERPFNGRQFDGKTTDSKVFDNKTPGQRPFERRQGENKGFYGDNKDLSDRRGPEDKRGPSHDRRNQKPLGKQLDMPKLDDAIAIKDEGIKSEIRREHSGKDADKGAKREQKRDLAKPAAVVVQNKDKKFKPQKVVIGEKKGVSEVLSDDFLLDDILPDTDSKKLRRLQKPKKSLKYENMLPQQPLHKAVVTEITIPEIITVKDLAEVLKKTSTEIIKKLMGLGLMATLNQEIDFDAATLIAEEFGVKTSRQVVVNEEDILFEDDNKEDPAAISRPPVVVVMGHVDHGKTSLLDAIRETNVTEKEAGGITQHIGAYTVKINDRNITFLDTPGHEAFTAMRARGAMVTDVAVLVVAADDGVMPQTVEAINHAKAANLSIIVAINKIDKPGANPDRVKQELTEHGIVIEDWGGDVICVEVSAKKRTGIEHLLEMILLASDVLELRANPDRQAKGTIIEAKLDKNRGPVSTLLVQRGTLKVGDSIVTGATVGRIRAMIDDKGNNIKAAGPSSPVEIIGLPEVPEAGEIFYAITDEKVARQLAEKRKIKQREQELKSSARVTLEDLFNQIKEGKVKDLNIIVKADVQGSVEAVRQAIEKLSNDEVRVKIIHSGVGAVTETDIKLAEVSNAIVIGFNVRPGINVVEAAQNSSVEIKLYRVIYNMIEDIEAAMKGMLEPKFKEVITGHVEIRQIFKVSGIGTIGGGYVTDGKINRNSDIRIVRDGIVIHEGKLASLKRFKDDAKEVVQGFECGLSVEKFNDIKENDIIEGFAMEQI